MPASGEEVQEQKLHRPDMVCSGVEDCRNHRDNNQGQRICHSQHRRNHPE